MVFETRIEARDGRLRHSLAALGGRDSLHVMRRILRPVDVARVAEVREDHVALRGGVGEREVIAGVGVAVAGVAHDQRVVLPSEREQLLACMGFEHGGAGSAWADARAIQGLWCGPGVSQPRATAGRVWAGGSMCVCGDGPNSAMW